MTNENFFDFYLHLTAGARKYLCFVTAVFLIAGIICAGLYLNLFGFTDSVNAYIFAGQLLDSMIRSMTAATVMTLLIDMLGRRYGEE
ncbi:MAG: hypothetical protein IJM51_06255 [Clostridia bacterium]|nr:hypothetical protein [Clostridia bacterium]